MAARLTDPEPGVPRWTKGARTCLLVVSVGLLVLVGVTGPNAATPDLAPRGWAPGTLLPWTLDPAVVAAALWLAYLGGAGAVALGLWRRSAPLRGWVVPAGLGIVALLTAPFGSGDHLNYLAYGRILVRGGDPWLESPIAWAGGLDPITSRVEPPWTEEPSVYGPFATMLHGLSAWLGGDVLRQGVWVWQVLVVLAWLGVRLALRRALPERLHGRVDVLWTLNPLVLGVGLFGAHVDVVACVFLVAAAAAARAAVRPATEEPRAGWWMAGWPLAALAGVFAGLAASTKFTYGVVGVGLLLGWWAAGQRGGAWLARAGAAVVGALVVVVPLYLWAGPHVFDQLERSRRAVSLATPWRHVLEWVAPIRGGAQTRVEISFGAAALAVLLALCLFVLSRPGTGLAGGSRLPRLRGLGADSAGVVALWVTAVLALAYSLAASYSLPWYDLMVWAALPAAAAGALDVVALLRMVLIACAYVPGRVLGMSPGVEDLTYTLRRDVAPWLVLALWLAVIATAVRSVSARPRTPGPTGTRSPSPPAPGR